MSFLSLSLIIFSMCYAVAGDLKFPRTADEITEALTLKDGTTIFEGVNYVFEKGQLYKVINGRRYKIRGLLDIVDSDIVPKIGGIIHFDFDSAAIRQQSYTLLDEFGKALNNGLRDAIIVIAGHTDSSGPAKYNEKLSYNRAESVVSYLTSRHHIAVNRLTIKAYGERKPIASNSSDVGRLLNRRVEFMRVK